jgi:hypothetical protein
MVEPVTRDQREFVYRLSLSLSRSTIDELDGAFASLLPNWVATLRRIAATW